MDTGTRITPTAIRSNIIITNTAGSLITPTTCRVTPGRMATTTITTTVRTPTAPLLPPQGPTNSFTTVIITITTRTPTQANRVTMASGAA